MSTVTSKYGIPVPQGSDPANVPDAMADALNAIDALIATATPLAALPTPGKFGKIVMRTGDDTLWFDNGSAFLLIPQLDATSSDISTSKPGDSAAAGSTGQGADAGHRHAREAVIAHGGATLGSSVALTVSTWTTYQTITGLAVGTYLLNVQAINANNTTVDIRPSVTAGAATISGPAVASDDQTASLTTIVIVTATATIALQAYAGGSNSIVPTSREAAASGATGYSYIKIA